MDSESDEGPSTPKKKAPTVSRKHYAQKYRHEWENEDLFKEWIAPVSDNIYKASCKLCDIKLSCELSTLRRHITSTQHKKAKNVKSTVQDLKQYFSKPTTSNDRKVATAELKLCAFVAEHCISFLAMDHLTDLLKECFPDSKIAGEIKLKRSKVKMYRHYQKCHWRLS